MTYLSGSSTITAVLVVVAAVIVAAAASAHGGVLAVSQTSDRSHDLSDRYRRWRNVVTTFLLSVSAVCPLKRGTADGFVAQR